jgi:transcriptional regulator with XRE-family HTH domain
MQIKTGFGIALKQSREDRRMSQLELALEAQVSTRHLSFLETERAAPSRDMVLGLAHALVLAQRETNRLLSLAGFAPVYHQSPLEAAHLTPLRQALVMMMERHAPWPAIVLDRHWNVHQANPSAMMLLTSLLGAQGPMNVIDILIKNDGAQDVIVNLPEVLHELLGRVRLERLEASMDTELLVLENKLKHALAPLPSWQRTSGQPIIPLQVRWGEKVLSFLTTIAHFGSSDDITIRDLRLELLFPADDLTREVLAGLVIS